MNARFLKYWVVVVVAISLAFGVQLLLLSENAHMNYALADSKREGERLKAELRLLTVEAASLRNADRVNAIARGTLKMEVPDASRIIVIEKTQEQHAMGGRR